MDGASLRPAGGITLRRWLRLRCSLRCASGPPRQSPRSIAAAARRDAYGTICANWFCLRLLAGMRDRTGTSHFPPSHKAVIYKAAHSRLPRAGPPAMGPAASPCSRPAARFIVHNSVLCDRGRHPACQPAATAFSSTRGKKGTPASRAKILRLQFSSRGLLRARDTNHRATCRRPEGKGSLTPSVRPPPTPVKPLETGADPARRF